MAQVIFVEIISISPTKRPTKQSSREPKQTSLDILELRETQTPSPVAALTTTTKTTPSPVLKRCHGVVSRNVPLQVGATNSHKKLA